jgi:hypothetical protein
VRDYGVVSPKFWIVGTGKELRGDRDAQLVALYLMTSPHATATGVFHLPVLYVSHEIGIPIEGASKALQRLIKEDFCTYDEACDSIFVHRLAGIQIAEELKPDDKRVSWLKKEVEKMPSELLKQRFLAVYGHVFRLVSNDWAPPASEAPSKPLASPIDAPSKPGSGSEAGSETGATVTPLREIVPRATESEIHAHVQRVKAVYPKAARPNWIAGEKNARNVVLRGHATWDELVSGCMRYAKLCDATGRTAMDPGNFFIAEDRPWTHDWAIPAPKGKPGAAPAPNNDAAWAEAKARAQAIGFREPGPTEPVGAYMTSVKLAETTRLETPHAERIGLRGIKRIGAT